MFTENKFPRLKCEPITLGAMILGGSALLGAGVNVISQHSANKANLKSVADTNAMNYQIFQEQKAYQTSERLASQNYNSPANQRSRLTAAGINPYFALGQVDSGNTTAQTAPAASPMQAYQAPALDYGSLISSLGQGIVQGQSIEENQLNLEYQRATMQTRIQQSAVELELKIAQLEQVPHQTEALKQSIENLKTQRDQMLEELDLFRSTKSERKAQMVLSTKQQELQNRSVELQNEYQEFMNDFAKSRSEKEMRLLEESIREAASRINLNHANASSALASKALTLAQEKGVKIDNFQKNKVNHLIRESVRLQNKSAKLNIRQQGADYWNPFRYSGQLLGGAGSHAVGKLIK